MEGGWSEGLSFEYLHFRYFLPAICWEEFCAQLYTSMRFGVWLMNEVVKGLQIQLQGAAQVVFLGRMGWFDVYSSESIRSRRTPYNDRYELNFPNNKVMPFSHYQKGPVLPEPVKDAEGYETIVPPRTVGDPFLTEANLALLKKIFDAATAGLQQLGFRKQNLTIIYKDLGWRKDGVEGEHEVQKHTVTLPKHLLERNDFARNVHIVAHEWAHAYWKILPKQVKSNFTMWYFKNAFTNTDSNLDPYALSGGPKEQFAELIGSAVAEPNVLTKGQRTLLRHIIAGDFPEQ